MSVDVYEKNGETYNFLDVYARRINNLRTNDSLKAIKETIDIEEEVERAKIKETKVADGKTRIDPESLVKEIQEDMAR